MCTQSGKGDLLVWARLRRFQAQAHCAAFPVGVLAEHRQQPRCKLTPLPVRLALLPHMVSISPTCFAFAAGNVQQPPASLRRAPPGPRGGALVAAGLPAQCPGNQATALSGQGACNLTGKEPATA